jgi:stage III sporulation protein AD
MDIIKIIIFVLVCVVLIITIKNTRPEYALLLEIAAGVSVFFVISKEIFLLYKEINVIYEKIGLDSFYLQILIKVIGIAYIAEFGIGFCKDANQYALASKIELAGKISILLVALPMISSILEKINLIIK